MKLRAQALLPFVPPECSLLKSEQNQLSFLRVSCVPLYEYQCKKCKHRFEKIRKFSDPPIRKCPECGGPVEQLLHAPAVQFKGSGWYVTDYAGKKPEAQAAAASSDSVSEKSDKKDAAKEKDAKPRKAEPKKTKE